MLPTWTVLRSAPSSIGGIAIIRTSFSLMVRDAGFVGFFNTNNPTAEKNKPGLLLKAIDCSVPVEVLRRMVDRFSITGPTDVQPSRQ
ncbi:MAG: hypothetical protein IH614_02075 [Desulfuromonadales bacterium]|nr:hypothetical protein [Desulfuromonadales bacterium]